MRALAIDTETTGLFPSKGCRAFTISACSSITNQIYLWHFPVNPIDRSVTYTCIQHILEVMYEHDTLVLHNCNFDMQVLSVINPLLHWTNLFRDFNIHDTMLMSHAFKSSDRHGLKENAVLYLRYPDDDQKALEDATIKSRKIAKKLGWCIADKNDLHESIIGTQKSPHKCDYWIPKAIAEWEGYPTDHPWRHLCDEYAGKDAERTLGLYIVLPEVMKSIPNSSAYQTPLTDTPYLPPVEYTGTLYDKYEEARQLLEPLLDMQDVGIPIKPRALQAAIKTFTERRDTTLATLRRMTGMPDFNPGSPIQLRNALFQDYGFLPVPGKMGKDGPSTDKDVLTALLSDAPLHDKKIPERYEFVVNIKDYRKENATLTYLNNYDKHSKVSDLKRDKRRVIISSFSQTGTGSGRLSSQNPNTTNVGKKDMFNPFADDKNRLRATLFAEILGIDTDARFSLRNVFGPCSGEQWTCIDYDQFQLRIFAIVSESYELVESFERGDDVHMTVARRIFGKDDITDVERTAAKAINFGLLFGAGPAKIERLAGVPGLYSLFMSAFPKAKVYLDAQSRLARSKGYVHTVGGYRLYVPFKAPHAASCYVIQGTEAEIVKRAMVGVHAYRKALYSIPTSLGRNEHRTLESPRVRNLGPSMQSNRRPQEIECSNVPGDNTNRYRPSSQASIPRPSRNNGTSIQTTGPTRRIPNNSQARRPPNHQGELREQGIISTRDMGRSSRPNSRTEDRGLVTSASGENFIRQGLHASRELACRSSDGPSFKLLMMVHDELVFSSRNLGLGVNVGEVYIDKYGQEKKHDDTFYFQENSPHVQELSTIMNIMESAGTCIGIPCKVDAKVTTTDWATRHSLEFERT